MSIDLSLVPWDQSTDQYWCARVTIRLDDKTIIMMLGKGTPDGRIEPSAGNIAVLFDESHLPTWEHRTRTD
jgi:hypothetical protein